MVLVQPLGGKTCARFEVAIAAAAGYARRHSATATSSSQPRERGGGALAAHYPVGLSADER